MFVWKHGMIIGTLIVAVSMRSIAQQPLQSPSQEPSPTIVAGISATPPDPQASQTPLISLTLDNVTLHDALYAIVREAGVTLMLNRNDTALTRKLATRTRLKFTAVALTRAAAMLLDKTDYRAVLSRDGRMLMITADSVKNRAEPRGQETGTISGTVLDSETEKGIRGVTITVVGTSFTAVTSADGNFEIRGVPAGEYTVTIKLMGYIAVSRPVRIPGNPPVTLRILLKQTANLLAGVVTTATGQQRKMEIGNSITSINADSVLRVAPVRSLTDLLETRVPGLFVQTTSGTPGDPSRLRLRGAASVNGNNDPIVIVDGIRTYAAQSDRRNANLAPARGVFGGTSLYAAPSPLDQIDPNTIETIDVFKGPSAAAMYGSDAANGVIVITTKKGRAGPPVWSNAIDFGISYMPGDYPEGLYRFGSLGYTNLPVFCDIADLGCITDSLVRFQALNDPHFTVLGTGRSNGLTSTVSGGTPQLRYRFTGSAASNVGLIKLSDAMREDFEAGNGAPPPRWLRHPDQHQTKSVGGELSSQISPRLSIAVTSSLFQSAQQRSSLGQGAIADLMSAYLRPTANPTLGGFRMYSDIYERVRASNLSTTHTAQINWQPVIWLPLTFQGGLNTMNRRDEALVPRGLSPNRDTLGHYGVGQATTLTRSLSLHTNVPLFTNRLSVATGMNYVNETSSDLAANLLGLPPGVNLPATGLNGRQASSGRTTFGWFIEPRLNLNSRFFVTPGFRLDNNGLAGQSARLMGLPKMNFSWIASEEGFFPWRDRISMFRIRAGAGSAGIQPGPADRLRLFQVDTSLNFSSMYQGGMILSNLGNTKIRPERSTEFDGGLDIELWQGRLTSELTVYRKTRYDAIISIPVPLSVTPGSLSPTIMSNIGVIRNMGTELSMTAQMIEGAAFGWNVSVHFAQNVNHVVRLNAGQQPITITTGGAETRIVAGYPLRGRWAKPIISYGDKNENGVIEASEVVVGDTAVFMGPSEPRHELSFTTRVSLLNGRLGLNASFQYTGGMTQLNDAMRSIYSPLNLSANDPNAPYSAQAAAVTQTSYGRIQTVDVLRFQTLSINYNVSRQIAGLFRANSMSVALQGSNLGLRTNYHGKDPNVNSIPFGNVTIDSGTLPKPRMWSLQLRMGT